MAMALGSMPRFVALNTESQFLHPRFRLPGALAVLSECLFSPFHSAFLVLFSLPMAPVHPYCGKQASGAVGHGLAGTAEYLPEGVA
jgi:hypothetical protein